MKGSLSLSGMTVQSPLGEKKSLTHFLQKVNFLNGYSRPCSDMRQMDESAYFCETEVKMLRQRCGSKTNGAKSFVQGTKQWCLFAGTYLQGVLSRCY